MFALRDSLVHMQVWSVNEHPDEERAGIKQLTYWGFERRLLIPFHVMFVCQSRLTAHFGIVANASMGLLLFDVWAIVNGTTTIRAHGTK